MYTLWLSRFIEIIGQFNTLSWAGSAQNSAKMGQCSPALYSIGYSCTPGATIKVNYSDDFEKSSNRIFLDRHSYLL